MQKKSAGSENLIGVGGSIRGGAAKIWGQLVMGLLSNFKNRISGGWFAAECGSIFLIKELEVVGVCPVNDCLCSFWCFDCTVPPLMMGIEVSSNDGMLG